MGAPEKTSTEPTAAAASVVGHLYVHIPFCHHICPYCSFYKHTPGKLANRAFVNALLAELDRRCTLVEATVEEPVPLRPQTIYFGGGTPTLLSTGHLDRLLSGFAERLDLSQVREWTVEANPATFDLEKARIMRRAGVTRVSLGVQSWSTPTLKTLGRDHTPAEAEAAYGILREAEIDAVNVDLMFSVPGESLDSWCATLDRTVTLAPDHISSYNLNYEEDTPFYERLASGEFSFDDDSNATFFQAGIERLTGAGFHHYEISNYARPGFESHHNRAYWNGADYLGIGPSAVSTIANRRWTNLADTAAYVAAVESGAAFDTEIETLGTEQKRTEAIALQLRTSHGLQASWLQNQGENEADPAPLQALIEEGLVTWNDGRLVLTDRGKPLVDSIAVYLL